MGAVLDNSNLSEAQGWAASAVARQRNYFESGVTRSYAFRLRQLKKLKEAIVQYQGQIQDALQRISGARPSRPTLKSARPLKISSIPSNT